MNERAAVVVASASDGVRAQLRLTLGDERFEVIEAGDTRSAATEIARRRPELVVLDDDLDGAANLASSLRAQPETEGVRILLLAPRDRAEDGLADVVDVTVGLPATPFALLRRIEGLLDG